VGSRGRKKGKNRGQSSMPSLLQFQVPFPVHILAHRSSITVGEDGIVKEYGPEANFFFVNLKIGASPVDAKSIGIFTSREAAIQLASNFNLPDVAVVSIANAEILLKFLENPVLNKPPAPSHVALFNKENLDSPAGPGPIPLGDFVNGIRNAIRAK
jgi:hypothetical protein